MYWSNVGSDNDDNYEKWSTCEWSMFLPFIACYFDLQCTEPMLGLGKFCEKWMNTVSLSMVVSLGHKLFFVCWALDLLSWALKIVTRALDIQSRALAMPSQALEKSSPVLEKLTRAFKIVCWAHKIVSCALDIKNCVLKIPP